MNQLLAITWTDLLLSALIISVMYVVFKMLHSIGKKKGKAPVVDLEKWEEEMYHDTKYKSN